METVDYTQLSTEDQALLTAARKAREAAYRPYSGYAVGAAILTADGRVFAGCNIENASYGLTCCAERVAIFSAIAAGARTFTNLAVVAGEPDQPSASPCGACRQVLAEFGPPFRVLLAAAAESSPVLVTRVDELLPLAFSFDTAE